jgi:hypothetical protein
MVQQAGVNLGRRLVAAADDEDLGGRRARGLRLGGVHSVEKLPEGVQQCCVVARSKDLGHKRALRPQEVARQLQRIQHERRLQACVRR